jgi:hypothetical protein
MEEANKRKKEEDGQLSLTTMLMSRFSIVFWIRIFPEVIDQWVKYVFYLFLNSFFFEIYLYFLILIFFYFH